MNQDDDPSSDPSDRDSRSETLRDASMSAPLELDATKCRRS